LIEGTAIGATLLVDDSFAENALAKNLIVGLELSLSIFVVLGKARNQALFQLPDKFVALGLRMLLRVEPVSKIATNLLLQTIVVSLIEFRRRDFPFRLASFFAQLIDSGTNFLDLRVSEFNGIDDRLFFHFLGSGFDHHDSFGSSNDHDVEQTVAHLAVSRINDQLAIDKADADRANRAVERNVRDGEGSGRAVDPSHVGVVLGVGRKYESDNLGFATEAFRKKWANRTVNLAAGKNLALARPAFALDEAAGNAPAGIGVFTVINRKREKVNSFAGIRIGSGGRENYILADAYDHRTMGLLGQFSGFERDLFTAGEVNRNILFH